MKSQSNPPSRDSHHSSHGTLQKKPSSFFRRRKKSVSEVELPPPLPAPLRPPSPPPLVPPIKLPISKADLLSVKAEPSPITSLRRAMNPYLKSSPTTPAALTPDALTPSSVPSPLSDVSPAPSTSPALPSEETEDLAERNVRGFSPDYDPPPSATIRSVDQDSKGRGISSSGGESQHMVDTPTRSPPLPPHPARTGSFLNDNSDSEESPRRTPGKRANRHLSERDALSGPMNDRSTPSSPLADKSLLSSTDHAGDKDGMLSPRTDSILDDDGGSRLTLPIEGVVSPTSTTTADLARRSATSLPSVTVNEPESKPKTHGAAKPVKPLDEPAFVVGDPTEDDRQKAQKIFDGNEDFIQKEKAAAWMGEEGPVRQRTLRAYMDLHDFRNQKIVSALRQVCNRLVLRAETQQVDRILVAFSKRWCDCNPHHGFKSSGKYKLSVFCPWARS